MRTMALGVLVLVGCGQLKNDPTKRWPDHRKHHDSELEALETLTKHQTEEIEILRQRIEKLEAAKQPATTTETATESQP